MSFVRVRSTRSRRFRVQSTLSRISHATYVVVGGPPPDAPQPPPAGSVVSSLVRIGHDGKTEVVADIGAYQVAHPDPDDLDMPPIRQSRIRTGSRCCPTGRVLVADAAANDLLLVDKDGQISTVAHFNPRVLRGICRSRRRREAHLCSPRLYRLLWRSGLTGPTTCPS